MSWLVFGIVAIVSGAIIGRLAFNVLIDIQQWLMPPLNDVELGPNSATGQFDESFKSAGAVVGAIVSLVWCEFGLLLCKSWAIAIAGCLFGGVIGAVCIVICIVAGILLVVAYVGLMGALEGVGMLACRFGSSVDGLYKRMTSIFRKK
jgi:hypothetical protein